MSFPLSSQAGGKVSLPGGTSEEVSLLRQQLARERESKEQMAGKYRRLLSESTLGRELGPVVDSVHRRRGLVDYL